LEKAYVAKVSIYFLYSLVTAVPKGNSLKFLATLIRVETQYLFSGSNVGKVNLLTSQSLLWESVGLNPW